MGTLEGCIEGENDGCVLGCEVGLVGQDVGWIDGCDEG